MIGLKHLRIERAEQIHIPGGRLIFVVFDVEEAVCSIVEHLGDDEGAFPSRSELVWLLLIHSEDQISFLEGLTIHVSGMESMQVLLIDSRSNHGHLSFFS